MDKKYFLYSSSQLKFRKDTESKMGRKFKPGWVIVGGKKLPFTELLLDKTNSRYSDAKVVYYGDPSKVKYEMPAST